MDTEQRQRCSRYVYSAAADVKTALLGRTPRYAPDRKFDTLHVRLDLDIDFAAKTLSGTCTTSLRAYEGGLSELVFDACGMKIQGARLAQGPTVRFTHKDGKLKLRLPRPLAAGEEGAVEIRYRVANPITGVRFVSPGPHNRDNPLQLWTQGQPEDSRYWFPCHDAPHEKATTEVVATVPSGFTAVSNGVLVEKRSQARTETFHWRMDHPHSLYLVTLAAGRFGEVAESWEGIPVQYYCREGREEDARRGFAKTPKVMEFFSEKTGVRYPYEKYAQVAVAEYPGGMENTTCTTQTEACLIPAEAALDNDMDYLVAHELAHQWFGDLVTCRDWSHAWLNEGFATYFEVLFAEHDKGQDEADYELYRNAQAYFHEDQDRYRRPVVCNTFKYPWVLFDRHLYEKGCWVLHMLRHELGEDAWWKAIGHYLRTFRDKSVETSDFIAAIEQSSGRNLRAFFDQWIFRAGYPTYTVHYGFEPKTKTAQVRIVQKGSETYSAPIELRFSGAGWTKDFTKTVDQKEHVFDFKLPGRPELFEFDPRYRILKKADIRKPFALWVAQLRRGSSSAGRIRAAKALAHWGDARAVAALSKSVGSDPYWGVASEAAHALGSIRSEAAFQALKKLLKVPHPKVRRAVVGALANFQKNETAAAVLPFFKKDPSLHVQAEAARTLGSLRDPKWIPLLKSKMRQRSHWDIVASGAIQGLANTRESAALPAVLAACRPPFVFPARATALRALGSFASASDDVVPQLCSLLSEILELSDERLTMAVIHTLGTCGDFRAVPPLEKALKTHTDTRIKTYCEEAIARIRGESEAKVSKKK